MPAVLLSAVFSFSAHPSHDMPVTLNVAEATRFGASFCCSFWALSWPGQAMTAGAPKENARTAAAKESFRLFMRRPPRRTLQPRARLSTAAQRAGHGRHERRHRGHE